MRAGRAAARVSAWPMFLLLAAGSGLLLLCSAPAWAETIEIVRPTQFPYLGNRVAVWVVAQLHILFAAFILGAPIFVVISEWLGMRHQDPKYDRLAKEVTKVTAILYSMTALTGGFFLLVLVALYPSFTGWLFNHFFPIFGITYPLLFIAETIVLYCYWYTWDSLQGEKKGRHLSIGILLNLIGIATLVVIDAPTAFMNTPVRAEEGAMNLRTYIETTATLWDKIDNFSWMPLNFHRLVGNICFGGFIAGLIAAYMYMFSKSDEERAYYDWMGFVGNFIGIGALLFLPLMGYVYGSEFYDYDASVGPYMMGDQLSMYFIMQGGMVGLSLLLFLLPIGVIIASASDAMRHGRPDEPKSLLTLPFRLIAALLLALERFGLRRRELVIKGAFFVLLFGNAIWMTPHAFVGAVSELTDQNADLLSLPSDWDFMALMPAKNTAAALMVLMILMSFILYTRAIKRGTVRWGQINFSSQFALIFLAFSAIWTMGLMGVVRSSLRKYFHVYDLVPDISPENFTPTLAYSGRLITLLTVVFFLIVSLAIWLALGMGHDKKAGSR